MTPLMKLVSIFIAVFLYLGVSLAAASVSERVETEHASSQFLTEHSALVPGKTTWVAFSQSLDENWHVYWKNPGDSGLPLTLKWDLPEGLKAGIIQYPLPERIPVGPLTNFGHHGTPVFLVPITVGASVPVGGTASLKIDATWLICEEICVPEHAKFSLHLPISSIASDVPEVRDLFKRARAALPQASDKTGAFSADPERLYLSIDHIDAKSKDVFFFPNKEGLIEPSAPQKIVWQDGKAHLSIKPGYEYKPEDIGSLKGLVTLWAGKAKRGFELEATQSAASQLSPAVLFESAKLPQGRVGNVETVSKSGLPFLLFVAFVGGITLNFMPCVFPIIFIKASSLLSSADKADPARLRRDGLFYTVGVVATFVIIGAVLLGLRASGEQLGWGFHLQSPPIVAGSAFVLLLVALNLFGVFEVGQSVQNIGSGLDTRNGVQGAFFTGALAVVVAAPCIGPLMSAPMAAAVLLPPFWGMLIFVLMAIGLAAPYLLLSFVPGVGKHLPKPGPWMKVLKQFLAFPVLAAASYFLWVFVQQTGSTGLAKGLVGAVIVAFSAWLFELSKGDGSRATVIRIAAAVALVLGVLPVLQLRPITQVAAAPSSHGAFNAEPYSATRLNAYIEEGRPVFINFTASWCVTCQFNKLTIFSQKPLAKLFADENVAFLVADWTLRDPDITQALELFGANGVPLYVYYPPSGDPEVLSLPLTEKTLRAVISK